MEDFVVKQYMDDRVTIKGNGFDGLEIGDTREEAQEFVDFLNKNNRVLLYKVRNLLAMVQYYQSKDPVDGLFQVPDGTLIDPNNPTEYYDIKLTRKNSGD